MERDYNCRSSSLKTPKKAVLKRWRNYIYENDFSLRWSLFCLIKLFRCKNSSNLSTTWFKGFQPGTCLLVVKIPQHKIQTHKAEKCFHLFKTFSQICFSIQRDAYWIERLNPYHSISCESLFFEIFSLYRVFHKIILWRSFSFSGNRN